MNMLFANNFFQESIWKKIFLTGLFPLIAFTLASGQVSFGIKAGPTFSRMNYDDLYFDSKSLTGFHGGIVAGLKVGSRFSLQPELLYSVKGSRFQSGNDLSKMEVHYISLPVMLGYSINNLTLKAGPEINFRTSVDSELLILFTEDDLFNSTEISFGAGISYKFLEKFGAEFRYTFGLTEAGNLEFTDVNGNSIDDDSDGKIQAIQLSLFYLFKS